MSAHRLAAAATPTAARVLVHHCRIELSEKVCTTPCRLASILLHEMCHAAQWVVDRAAKPPHGAAFRKWGA